MHWQLTLLIGNCDSAVGKLSTVPAKPGHGGRSPFVCSIFEPVGGISSDDGEEVMVLP